jgi:hypothetical protein
MLPSPLQHLARHVVDHGNLLVARMKITSYNLYCGSFLSEPCLGKFKFTRKALGAALRHTIK